MDHFRASEGGALLIDGKAIAAEILADAGAAALRLAARDSRPGLAVVLVGENPASRVYVGAKGRAARELGFHSIQRDLPASTTQTELLAVVAALNADPAIHGILVQLPLPAGIDPAVILGAIDPGKDVDGFHPLNAGAVATGDFHHAFAPCTPAGAMILARRACARLGVTLSGMEAVVVGRSNIVGKPAAQLLLAADCTVTIAHSRTRDLAAVIGRADLLVAAIGRPGMIAGEWIKPGAIVIDVGINRVAAPKRGLEGDGRPKTRLVGDVAFAAAARRAGAITPVPGGVGPMTIAMLMANTVTAAGRRLGLEAFAPA